MKATLAIIGIISLLAAISAFIDARSAAHEIVAGIAFLAFVIISAAFAIIGAIERATKKLDRSSAASAASSVRYNA